MQPAQPRAHLVGIARPVHVIAGQSPVTERMVDHHGPPEAEVPRQPGDARRTDVISLVIGPVGVPHPVRALTHAQPRMSRTLQAFLGGEAVEVEAGELPRRLELRDQVAVGVNLYLTPQSCGRRP